MKKGILTGLMVALLQAVLWGCVVDNSMFEPDGGYPGHPDADGDSDEDTDSEDTCEPQEYLGCDENEDVCWFDSCDQPTEVVEECPDERGLCVTVSPMEAECGCEGNWDIVAGCGACLAGFGGAACSTCQVGWGGDDCSVCVGEYAEQDGLCVFDDLCGSDWSWLEEGDLPRPDRLASEFDIGGTASEPSVIDLVTGLEWQRCLKGQTWAGAHCLDPPTQGDALFLAINCTNEYGGQVDWRAPNITELMTLLDLPGSPALEESALGGNDADGNVWSNTVDPLNDGAHLGVSFHSGGTVSSDGDDYTIRCVRGGASTQTPSARFVVGDSGGGTVVDTWSGLEWRRCADGQLWSGDECEGEAVGVLHSQLDNVCGGSFSGKDDWFAPDLHQLRSLALFCTSDHAFHEEAFPQIDVTEPFWSSTEHTVGSTAYRVELAGGSFLVAPSLMGASVLCVRETQ